MKALDYDVVVKLTSDNYDQIHRMVAAGFTGMTVKRQDGVKTTENPPTLLFIVENPNYQVAGHVVSYLATLNSEREVVILAHQADADTERYVQFPKHASNTVNITPYNVAALALIALQNGRLELSYTTYNGVTLVNRVGRALIVKDRESTLLLTCNYNGNVISVTHDRIIDVKDWYGQGIWRAQASAELSFAVIPEGTAPPTTAFIDPAAEIAYTRKIADNARILADAQKAYQLETIHYDFIQGEVVVNRGLRTGLLEDKVYLFHRNMLMGDDVPNVGAEKSNTVNNCILFAYNPNVPTVHYFLPYATSEIQPVLIEG